MVANHTRRDSMSALAEDILAHAPPRFALAGLSMGGYIAFEIMRQAPVRVLKLALLDTSAQPDTQEQKEARKLRIRMAEAGEYDALPGLVFPAWVHTSRGEDRDLKAIGGGDVPRDRTRGFHPPANRDYEQTGFAAFAVRCSCSLAMAMG